MSMVVAPPSESQASTHSQTESDYLLLDEHTLNDLEIFKSETGGTSLFRFCNLTQTDGGARILRRRMERPWSNAAYIQDTQDALSFILARRQTFENMPSAYTANRVDHYARDALPIVVPDNTLEFGLGALSLWSTHDRHYINIVLGVNFTSELVQGLRSFLDQAELASPAGELSPLFEEMHALLARTKLSGVPKGKIGGWPWGILRLDQIFRLHEKSTILRLLQLVFEIDALVAMADVTISNGFFMPEIEEGSFRVIAEGLVHPLLQNPVANPVKLDQEHRLLFLTGPNMAGKTTYLRAFATAYYLAHLGMGVPARSFCFVPAQRLFSSISLNDNLSSGVSYFRAEALRVKAVAQAVADGYRVVALMDEPFKGTNIKDAFDASLAIMEGFATKEDCLFMFSSHLIELSEQLNAADQIDYRYFDAEEREERLRFDYRLRKGVSNQRLGMRVLEEEGIFELLNGTPTTR
jgi:DNA mismatch repair ATPase MutS